MDLRATHFTAMEDSKSKARAEAQEDFKKRLTSVHATIDGVTVCEQGSYFEDD
jgi:hypothetical protein